MAQDNTSDASGDTQDKPSEWQTLPTRPAPGPPRAADLAGSFPQLEIIELLGQGGMGYVYKARQKGLDRLVALKLLPPEVSTDAGFAERFEREARAMAKLSHPGIVIVHDSGQAGGLYYFVMEYVDGLNLRELLNRNEGRIEMDQALRIVHSVCDALDYAHDEGVIHRDIKPENILLDTKGRVKIADFGLAKLLGSDDDGTPSRLTLNSPQQLLGTPYYMSPEQTERPLTVDHRADIYSVGVVFYEMLTGELPLGRFPLPSEIGRGEPVVDEIIARTLDKNPDRRFQRASEVRTAVASALSGVGKEGDRPPSRQPVKGSVPFLPAGVEVPTNVAIVLRSLRWPAILLILSAIAAMVSLNPLGIVIIIGAIKMKRLENRWLAITAAALALLPYSVCIPLGVVAGVWSLVLLFLPDTRAAFEAAAASRAAAAGRK